MEVKFSGKLIGHSGMDAAYVEFPFDVKEIFGTNGQVKIIALIDGEAYRGSLANMGQGCHVLGVTKAVRNKIGKKIGDMVSISLKKDEEVRVVNTPPELLLLFETHSEAKAFFEKLSYTNKKEYVAWIETAVKEETKQKRLNETIIKLENGYKNPSAKK